MSMVRIRVLEGHYRDRSAGSGDSRAGVGTFIPAGTILELPSEQAEAMLSGGTAELAPEAEPIEKPSLLLKRFERLRRRQ